MMGRLAWVMQRRHSRRRPPPPPPPCAASLELITDRLLVHSNTPHSQKEWHTHNLRSWGSLKHWSLRAGWLAGTGSGGDCDCLVVVPACVCGTVVYMCDGWNYTAHDLVQPGQSITLDLLLPLLLLLVLVSLYM